MKTREIANSLMKLDKRLRNITEGKKFPNYVKAEFVKIEDALVKLSLALHEKADSE